MKPRFARVLLAAIALGANACFPCQDSDTESRGAESRATIISPATLNEQVVAVSVYQSRSPAFNHLLFSVTGVELRWHVRAVRLLEAGPEGRLLFDLPLARPGGDGPEAASGQLSGVEPVTGTFDHFVALLLVSSVVAEITTDIPGMEIIRVPLRLEHGSHWHEDLDSCVYT